MHRWDPDRYLTYADERGRPFVELLARIGAGDPVRAVDPDSSVSSRSETHVRPLTNRGGPAVEFRVADLRDWVAEPGEPVDVLVSNATLQWIPGHLDLLPGLVGRVSAGGWLAFQVPGNFDEPSHTIRTELAGEAAYEAHTRGVAVPSSHDPAVYLETLTALGCDVDAWETTYLHVLTGDDPVFTWVSGTGARPTLQSLSDGMRQEFETEFRARRRAAYPPGPAGVVLPFRRIFVVARVPGERT